MVIEFNKTKIQKKSLRGISNEGNLFETFGWSGKVVLLQLITQMILQRGLIKKL